MCTVPLAAMAADGGPIKAAIMDTKNKQTSASLRINVSISDAIIPAAPTGRQDVAERRRDGKCAIPEGADYANETVRATQIAHLLLE
jgi:hypothetical protein